jgi:hemolysin activation/secretion protein
VEFGRQFNLGGKPDHDRRGHFRGGYYGGYVYSYGVPYPVYVIPEDVYQQQQAQEQQPEAPAPTVFENRPTVRPAPNPTPTQAESQPQPSEPPAKNENHVAEEQIPIVLVFKDGHQMEISNYAIVGNTLYELGPYTSHKISLSDLNLKETIQKNDERGIEFSLPSSYKSAG